MKRAALIFAAFAVAFAAPAAPVRTATESFVTNKIAAAIAAIPGPDYSPMNAELRATIEAVAPSGQPPANYAAVSNAAMSAAAQTNDFLRLTGGMMSGDLKFSGAASIQYTGVWGVRLYANAGTAGNRIYTNEGDTLQSERGLAWIDETTNHVHAAAVAATNYTDSAISTNNPAFVAAVLATPTGAPDGDVADIAEYGGYGTVGAAILALIAGLAALKRRIGTAETAISGKADAADLRYRIAEAVVRKTLPADCFPVTFTNDGVSYSINSLVNEEEASAAGDMYITDNGTDYSLTMVESPTTGSELMSLIEVATFSAGGVFENSGYQDLQFGGVSPVAGTSPTLADIQVLADRTVNCITATDETSLDIELPSPVIETAGVPRARDFLLDIDNVGNASDLALEFTALGVDYAFVPLEDDSISEMMTIGAGERVRLYFTETPYMATGSLPVINVASVTLGDFVTSTTTEGGN